MPSSRIRIMSLSRRTLIEACRPREARVNEGTRRLARYRTHTNKLLIPASLRTTSVSGASARGLSPSTIARAPHNIMHSHYRNMLTRTDATSLGFSSSLQQMQAVQLQRRNFGSTPPPCANAGTKSKSNVKDLNSSTQSAENLVSIDDNDPSSSGSNALFFAAQEASRLSKLAAKENKRGIAFTEGSVQLALDAASALLIISRPSNFLADAILHRSNKNTNLHSNKNTKMNQNAPQIASLHRAFLEITSWCIDLVPYRYEQQQLQVHQQQQQQQQDLATMDNAVLDRSLTLARRAYDLQLPFHLPLYTRLMEAVAQHKTDDSIASTILDISSWVTATLDAPVDAAFFSHTLTTLVRRQQLGQVVDLLKGMQILHNIPHLDPATTTEMLTLLRDAVRESLLQDPGPSDSSTGGGGGGKGIPNHNNNRRLSEEDATQIVSLLEPSVMHILEQRESSEQLRDRLTNMLSELENDEMAELLERLAQVEDEDDLDDDDDVDSDSDDDEEVFDSDEDDNHVERAERTDPIDLVVDSILTKNVTDVKAKRLLSNLIKRSRFGGGVGDHNIKPRIQAIEFQDGEDTIHAVKVEIDSDSDLSDDEDEESDELLYSRDKEDLYQFPDVTAQLVQLNDGRTLRFTRKFEDVLWARDLEDDFVLFDKLFRDSQQGKVYDDDSSSSSSSDDDDDDDDDSDDEADDDSKSS